MGAVDFSIDMRLVEALRRVLPLSVFVETGTFEGDAIERARDSFEEIHTIELSDHYHARAVERFAGAANVRLYHGDSSRVLGSLRSTLESKAVLYWLDAHWCVANETAGEQSQCPLLDELAALGRLNADSVVLIDDARLFLATPPDPHEASNWPRLQEVVERLLLLSSDHEIMVVNDVIVFFPSSALAAVSNYARSHGVDWLAQLHRLRELEQERDALAGVAAERLEAIESLTRAAEDDAATIAELTDERDLQARAAHERLATVEDLARERDRVAAAAEEGRAIIVELTRERDLQATTAQERLAAIEKLATEHDRVAAAAEERAAALERLDAEREALAVVAGERLAAAEELRTAMEELRLDRNVQADAAEARLAAIEELERERDLQAQTATERLTAIEELERERDLQARTAAERLVAFEALERETTWRLQALEGLSHQRHPRS